ncbi:MAG TPA: hypothetical protein VGP88_08215 [Thermoplasmata archaeon]|jgi:hypothetical protein|nr:hypothetical protein [Thermoplasmata archaeon]
MRLPVVVFGVVLLIAGAALWFVPLTSASTTVQVPVGDAYDFGVPTGYIVDGIPYTATWNSGAATNVTIYSCGTNSACPNEVNAPVVVQHNGSSGSLKWTSSAGHYFLLVPNTTVNLTLSYLEPVAGGLAGIGTIGFGAIVIVVGLALRRPVEAEPDSRPAAAGTAASPSTAPDRPPK